MTLYGAIPGGPVLAVYSIQGNLSGRAPEFGLG